MISEINDFHKILEKLNPKDLATIITQVGSEFNNLHYNNKNKVSDMRLHLSSFTEKYDVDHPMVRITVGVDLTFYTGKKSKWHTETYSIIIYRAVEFSCSNISVKRISVEEKDMKPKKELV